MLKKISCALGLIIATNANGVLVDIAAPHQFQAGEAASATLFNQNMNTVYQAVSDDQQILGLNNNTIIARNSLVDALNSAVEKEPSPSNIVTVLLNSSTTYTVNTKLAIPSYVTIKTASALANGAEGAILNITGNGQIVLNSSSKLIGVNINSTSNEAAIMITGLNTLIENSNITATNLLQIAATGSNNSNILTINYSTLKNADFSKQTAVFNVVGNVQNIITLNQTHVQNPHGKLTNGTSLDINSTSSEINTDYAGVKLNSVFSYKTKEDGKLVPIT